MSQRSLGLIETFGLLPAVEAADAAVKSANVDLLGYEFAKGSGMTVVKVEGDVGAVKAAIAAAYVAASKVGRVAATRVIPRPAKGLEMMVRNGDTKGYQPPEPPAPTSPDESGPEPDPDRGGATPEQEAPASEPVVVTTQDSAPAPAVVEEVLPEPVPVEEPAPVEEVPAPAEPEVEVVSEPEPVPVDEVHNASAEAEVASEPEAAPVEEAQPVPAEPVVEVVPEPEKPKVEAKKTKPRTQKKKKG